MKELSWKAGDTWDPSLCHYQTLLCGWKVRTQWTRNQPLFFERSKRAQAITNCDQEVLGFRFQILLLLIRFILLIHMAMLQFTYHGDCTNCLPLLLHSICLQVISWLCLSAVLLVIVGGVVGHTGWLNSWRAASTTHLLYFWVTLWQAVEAGFSFRCVQQYAMSPSKGGGPPHSPALLQLSRPLYIYKTARCEARAGVPDNWGHAAQWDDAKEQYYPREVLMASFQI